MRKINKKGIMLKFLTSLLLAIIVFAPACLVSSSFFRTSTQALENFDSFVDDLQEFAETKPIGYRGSSMLIMDEETAVVYFDNRSEVLAEVVVTPVTEYSSGTIARTIRFEKPDLCALDSSCICLFRDVNIEKNEDDGTYNHNIKGNTVLCSELDYHLSVEVCGWGEEKGNIFRYDCENGFVIERNLIKEVDQIYYYYENERRQSIYLTRLDTEIRLSGVS